MAMDDLFQRIVAAIQSRRDCGRTTCVIRGRDPSSPESAGDDAEIVDRFVAEFDFTGLGEKWAKVTREDALAILTAGIQRDGSKTKIKRRCTTAESVTRESGRKRIWVPTGRVAGCARSLGILFALKPKRQL